MASSYYTNTLHVNFESVLAMDDPGMVSMFQALMAPGLEGFLGCPAVIYEATLVDFFENASVRDEGLSELSEILKDLVFDARIIVSLSGEPVSMSGKKKKEMKFEYRLLCDILAKTISINAGSFDALTMKKFLMLTAIICEVKINWNRVLFNILKDMVTAGSRQAKGYAVQISLLLENVPTLELGESSEFPSSKILPDKTVHRYIVLNEKIGAEEAAHAPKPTILSLRLSKFCTVFVQNNLFNGLSITDIHSFVSSIVFERTALRDVQSSFVSAASQNVQLAFSSVVEDEDNQMDIDQRLASLTTTADSSMNFIDNDIILGDAATSNQPSLPTVATNLSTYLDDFRTLLWQRLDAQSEDIRHIDGRTLDDVQTLRFNEFRKGFLAHSAAVTADSMDFRKEFRALNAKVTSLDEQVAATRNDLLEFRAQAQETLNLITDQLSELISYINRGGNDKKREVSSSRHQPPPDGQNRGRSGGRSSSGNRSGSSKRRHYSSSGGPFRRSFEDWLG
ncbi:hypothetical protein F511_22506 [Dorcoceras hygrometricum]|uniref:Dystroglycan-like n=1 Tax=Dorcoceras hygrometricum TaxID=472368 RepID=A0A2Z7CMN7_9LAMI|nr:hypothetical protein F511_22506 [Dorcoceras hygrometricum]